MTDMRASHVSLFSVVLSATILVALGYVYAVMKRARSDLKKTKEAIKGLRKGFWGSLWVVIKVGFWVTVGTVLLVAWNIKDWKHDHPGAVTPAQVSVSPSQR